MNFLPNDYESSALTDELHLIMVAPLGFEPRLDTLEPCGTIRYAREPYGASAGSRTLSTCLEGRYAAINTSLAYLEPPSGNAPNFPVYKTGASLQCFGGIFVSCRNRTALSIAFRDMYGWRPRFCPSDCSVSENCDTISPVASMLMWRAWRDSNPLSSG